MELKTNQIKGKIKIFIFADLVGTGVDVKEIEETILNMSFNYWDIDTYNSIRLKDNQLVDMFVFETFNSLVFNVNDIF